jgi:hypothetical protein
MGDSSLVFFPNANNFWADNGQGGFKGVGIGFYARGLGAHSFAAGYSSYAPFPKSVSIGSNLVANQAGAIVIGEGLANSVLRNNCASSLMVGFRSDVPTLFVGPADGTTGSLGKVGVGTSSPLSIFHISSADQPSFTIDNAQTGSGYAQKIKVMSANVAAITIENNGIQTFVLKGDGSIRTDQRIVAREIEVNVNPWYDHVFSENYELISIDSLSVFISRYHHLPDIPSAADVADKGVPLGNMTGLLLKKIEELTLYIIDLNARIEQLENANRKE